MKVYIENGKIIIDGGGERVSLKEVDDIKDIFVPRNFVFDFTNAED